MSTPVCAGCAVKMTPATSPSEISRTLAPGPAAFGDQFGMARAFENADDDVAVVDVLGARQRRDVFAGLPVEVDEAGRIAGTNGDFVHVDVGRVEQGAGVRYRDDGDRAGHVLRAERRALQRRDGQVEQRTIAFADFLADEHRGGVLVLADDDASAKRQPLHFRAHAFARRPRRRPFRRRVRAGAPPRRPRVR